MRSTTARGYGAAHNRRRKSDQELVEAGGAVCWRCGRPIVPMKLLRRDGRMVSNWHLGHDDDDRTVYRGPEHEKCNLRAGGRQGARETNRKRRGKRRPQVQAFGAIPASRQW